MKTIIGLGVLSFLASLISLSVLLGRTTIFDRLDGTDLTYPMFGLTVSWIMFISCSGFVMIRRARKKVSLWPVERRMYSLVTTKMVFIIYDLLDREVISVRELQNNPEFLAILYEYLDYKKSGGRDNALPHELLTLFREVVTDISAIGKGK